MGAILGIEEGVQKATEAEPKFELKEAAVELNLVVGREGKLSLVGKGSAGHEAAHTVKVHLQPDFVGDANELKRDICWDRRPCP